MQGPDFQLGMEKQKSLFWWGSPHLVISLIQFMNFGYALSLAIVIMYWPYLTGYVEPHWFAVAIFVCYAVFLYILGLVLPQYTLCTSLGYLTNKRELQQTVAMHRLEEMQMQQQRKLIQIANLRKEPVIVLAKLQEPMKSIATSSHSQQKVAPSALESCPEALDPPSEKKTLLLADLVKAGTDTLRTQLPEASRENLLAREQRLQARQSNRKKAVSEGVAAMRGMRPLGFQATAQVLADKIKKAEMEKRILAQKSSHNRRKSSSQPDTIKGWQEITSQDETKPSHKREKSSSHPDVIKGWQTILSQDEEKPTMRRSMDDSDAMRLEKEDRQKSSSSDGRVQASRSSTYQESMESGYQDRKSIASEGLLKEPTEENGMHQWKNDRPVRLTRSRHVRRKSQSASAVIQSWRDFSVPDEGGLSHNPNPHVYESCISNDIAGLSTGDDSDDYRITRTGKTIQVPARGYRSEHPTISGVEHDLDFHPLRETEREYGFDDTTRTAAKAIDMVVVEDPGSLRHGSEKKSDNEVEDDNDTVGTDKSIGNLSDVDVVQTVRGIFPIAHTDSVPWYSRMLRHLTPVALIQHVKSYFKGSVYRALSHVFGTMVVFFFIGFRVEAMIAKTGVFFEPESSWSSSLMLGFWFEASWLFCFAIMDFTILILLPFAKCESRHDLCLNVAAIADILLSGMTMTLLFVAESQRCCYDEPDQQTVSGPIDGEPTQRQLGPDYDFEYECSCPSWGRRTYNGLGVIEPFTSLIALRLFRFLFADLMLKRMDKRHSKHTDSAETSTDSDKNAFVTPSHDSHDGGHGDGRNSHDAGTLIEHWERAISEFPDIVDKYGQFSGELLQAMLGLHVDVVSSDGSTLSQAESNENQNDKEKRKNEDDEKPDTWQSHIRLARPQYMHLSAEAQGFIIAGILSKPVKVMHHGDSKHCVEEMPTVDEDCDDLYHPSTPKLALAEFEVDMDKMSIERKADYAFLAPFASLVRSMRRCDRKLIPFLSSWVSVDVVMTQFEIVYFEAVDHISSDDENIRRHADTCRSALQATKGGKGLRLCDVALGRKVVGHLDLSHVTEVRVEQDSDVLSDVATLEMAALLFGDTEDMASEYWFDSQASPLENHKYGRAVRWLMTHEERLRLTTEAGTLYLRFYADLEYTETEMNDFCHEMSTLKKEVAFQWAESVVRIVGPQQLYKQNLPHFGEGNDEELRDYLETHHFHEKELESAQKEIGDRFPDLPKIGGRFPDHPKPMSVRFHRRSRSFGETERFHQRSRSFGETASEREIPKRPAAKSLRRLLSLGTSERSGMRIQSMIRSDTDTADMANNSPEEPVNDTQLLWLAMSTPSPNNVSASVESANPTAIQDRRIMGEQQSSEAEIANRHSNSLPEDSWRTGTSSGIVNEHNVDAAISIL
jgi:hypothetical protein